MSDDNQYPRINNFNYENSHLLNKPSLEKSNKFNRIFSRLLLDFPKGLPNIGNSCYINCVVQSLNHLSLFKKLSYGTSSDRENKLKVLFRLFDYIDDNTYFDFKAPNLYNPLLDLLELKFLFLGQNFQVET